MQTNNSLCHCPVQSRLIMYVLLAISCLRYVGACFGNVVCEEVHKLVCHLDRTVVTGEDAQNGAMHQFINDLKTHILDQPVHD